ncbi:J domain-containing protein [Favolaschia claudopus]|uniref:Adenine DNA glycosylase n=1 Tax=Favolaschia claudopus TaxID=2862362 RepID=A0AAW0D2P6_9AGAR
MVKRKILNSDAESSDDQLDVSYQPKTRKTCSSAGQRSKKRTRHESDGANDASVAPQVNASHAKAMHVINAVDVPSIRTALVQWFHTAQDSRPMPWRNKQYDPKILNAEQRAQRAYEVATVIPYYNRWLEKFPTIRAKKAVDEYDGKLPDNAADMQANIPGIGRYSAGAICSIAYGESAPVLDGNVNRLLSRFLALHASPKAKATLNILWDAASAMVRNMGSTEYPGDVNQALIELGSTVCKVRDPSCTTCPIRSWCSAYAATQNTQPALVDIEDLCELCEPLTEGAAVTVYPMKADKKKAREELDIVNVVEWRSGSDRQFLLVRRPEGGLLAGLDEFPTSSNVPNSISRKQQFEISHKILSELLHPDVQLATQPSNANETMSIRITKVQPAGDIVHVFSHIKKTYRVQWVRIEGASEPPAPALALAAQTEPDKTTKNVKGKGKGKVKTANKEVETGLRARWVPLDAVAAKNLSTGSMKVAILNLSKFATDAEIHERHRSLSLLFHPDRHQNVDPDSQYLANQKFLDVQKAYEVLSDPFFRYACEPGLAVNWLEETRTRSSEELQRIFRQVEHDWLQRKVDSTISPKGRVVCTIDASSLSVPYQGFQDDGWRRRLQNRLEDVRVSSFTSRYALQKRITELFTVSLAARISRRRGNFIGTLRHQYSPRLAFEATSAFLYPYDTSLRCEYESDQNSLLVQTTIPQSELTFPPVFISVNRRLFRRPDSLEGRLDIDLGLYPQVAVNIISQPSSTLLNQQRDPYIASLPLTPAALSWSHGVILNSYDPRLVGEWALTLTELSVRCKLGLEWGFEGLAWFFSGSWKTDDFNLKAMVRLSQNGVVLKIDAIYLQQRLSFPILLTEHHDSFLALWGAAIPSFICISGYYFKARKLEPHSLMRRDAETVISFMQDRARDSFMAEAEKGGLAIIEATYGAIETADRDLGLVWDVTVPLQTLVRGSQLSVSGRHHKPSIQGFLDPAPFTLKSLRIRYLFHRTMHFVEVPDYLSVVLPLADHVVN